MPTAYDYLRAEARLRLIQQRERTETEDFAVISKVYNKNCSTLEAKVEGQLSAVSHSTDFCFADGETRATIRFQYKRAARIIAKQICQAQISIKTPIIF